VPWTPRADSRSKRLLEHHLEVGTDDRFGRGLGSGVWDDSYSLGLCGDLCK